MRRELSSATPVEAGTTASGTTDCSTGRDAAAASFRSLAARKLVVGTAATAALAAAAGLGVAAPAMTAAADRTAASAATPAAAAAATPGTTNLQDTMDRTVAAGMGSAPVGGAWTTWGRSFSVSGGKAHLAGIAPGTELRSTVEGVQARDEALSAVFSVPAVPTAGYGSYFGLVLRRQANNDAIYARVKVSPGGTLSISTKLTAGGTTTDIGQNTTLPATVAAGRSYVLEAVATGSTSTRVSARVYALGGAAPAWQSTGTATVTAAMATRGSVGIWAYASTSAGPFSVDVDTVTGQNLAVAPTSSSPTSSPTTSTPTSSPTTSTPTSSPTTSTPTSSPTTSSPTSSPTTSSPTSSPTTSSPTGAPTSSSTDDPEGGIVFGAGDTGTPTSPVSAPPTTPVTTPPPPPAPGMPGPSNTGPRPGVALTVYNGSITASTPGQVIENLDIRGGVRVTAPNVVIRNCIVRGVSTTAWAPAALVDALNATNLQIIDTEISPSLLSENAQAGVWGRSYSLLRVDIHGTVDGLQVHGNDVHVVDSWIHDTTLYPHSPFQGGGPTHNDGIQVFGGANITVTGSRIENNDGSAMQISPNVGYGAITGMVWSGNWIDGGTCSLNLAAGAWGKLPTITLTANRFGNHQAIAGCAIIGLKSQVSLAMTANVWDANNLPVLPKLY